MQASLLAILAVVHSTTLAPSATSVGATGPSVSRSAWLAGTSQAAASVLLVDDDESDNNNNPGDSRLSVSDAFYRQLLQDRSLKFDTFVVPRYSDGPGVDRLRPYSLIIWYTGASNGGNRDNTAVISLRDEATVRTYLQETGGSVILFSPGYLNNALGAGGSALWDKKDSAFLQDVLGVRGGRGLLQRFKDVAVTSADGSNFVVAKKPPVETQVSALNPASAQVLFSATLDPDGKGPRSVPVATSQAVGRGRMIYVGFTFENLTTGAGAAFGNLLSSAGALNAASATTPTPASASYPKRGTTETMEVAGTGALTEGQPFVPRRGRTEDLTVTGIGGLAEGPPFVPKRLRTDAMTVTGTGSIR
ncbi:MAG: hypothetical protein WCP29_05245 [Acidobacteriota bacterium]